MNLKMEFTLRNGTKKIVGEFEYLKWSFILIFIEYNFLDMPYNSESRKNCKNIIIGKCEQYMWLEDLSSDKQDKVRLKIFLEQ